MNTCQQLQKNGKKLFLIIAGDGKNRTLLERIAAEKLSGSYLFLGKIPRTEMHRYYSSADLFVFPGINESLGMVYLEAQSCRLPVVALQDWGAKEAVIHNQTGLLSPASDQNQFTANVEHLLNNKELRLEMGHRAEIHVNKTHNLEKNYSHLTERLQGLTKKQLITKQ